MNINLTARFLFDALRLHTVYLRGSEPVIIYQMGKVGSTSVYELLNSMTGFTAFQVHRLNPLRTQNIRDRFLSGELYYKDMKLEQMLNTWINRTPKEPLKFICGIREPISHAYSAYFQNIPRSTRGEVLDPIGNVARLAELFPSWEELDSATTWIDRELSDLFGVDIYELPFCKEKGYETYYLGKYSLLLYKSALGDDVKAEAFSKFLGVSRVEIQRLNETRNKQHLNEYRQFVEKARIPDEVIEAWLESRYVRKYFDETEIQKARHFYSPPIVSPR